MLSRPRKPSEKALRALFIRLAVPRSQKKAPNPSHVRGAAFDKATISHRSLLRCYSVDPGAVILIRRLNSSLSSLAEPGTCVSALRSLDPSGKLTWSKFLFWARTKRRPSSDRSKDTRGGKARERSTVAGHRPRGVSGSRRKRASPGRRPAGAGGHAGRAAAASPPAAEQDADDTRDPPRAMRSMPANAEDTPQQQQQQAAPLALAASVALAAEAKAAAADPFALGPEEDDTGDDDDWRIAVGVRVRPFIENCDEAKANGVSAAPLAVRRASQGRTPGPDVILWQRDAALSDGGRGRTLFEVDADALPTRPVGTFDAVFGPTCTNAARQLFAEHFFRSSGAALRTATARILIPAACSAVSCVGCSPRKVHT